MHKYMATEMVHLDDARIIYKKENSATPDIFVDDDHARNLESAAGCKRSAPPAAAVFLARLDRQAIARRTKRERRTTEDCRRGAATLHTYVSRVRVGRRTPELAQISREE